MRSLTLFLVLFVFLPARADDPAPFEIREGDRVVLLGDALLERENTYGYLETRMHEQFPDRKFIVRNLSWAGDTPRGWSRASFDPPEKGFERLKEAIALVKPTVVFLGYGMAASLQEMTDRAQDITLNRDEARYGRGGGGEKGGPETGEPEPMSAARFKKELGELMDAIEKISIQNPRDPDALRPGHTTRIPWADIRFILLSPIRHEDLRAVRPGLPDPAPHNALLEQYSKVIEELAKEKGARFVGLWGAGEDLTKLAWSSLTQNGIHLHEDGYNAATLYLMKSLFWAEWPDKLSVLDRSSVRAATSLRAAVLKKNDLFFHRFRPENATYLFGFRKHEQGQNAVEIPKFDPLIEAADAEIDRVKRTQNGSPEGHRPPLVPGAASSAEGGTRKMEELVERRLQRIIIPKLEFKDATIREVVDFLKVKSFEWDPETDPVKKGVNLGLKLEGGRGGAAPPPRAIPRLPGSASEDPEQPRITVTLSNVSLMDALKRVAELAKLKFSIEPDGYAWLTAAAATTPVPASTTPPSLPNFTVQDGYQIELWAQNPLLEKPTQMNWDALGRLWVCSSSLYPQIEPGQAANDKILILEDTDRDGKADKSTVFADGLLIPTAVVPDLGFRNSDLGFEKNAAAPAGNEKPAPREAPGSQILNPKSEILNSCYVGQSTELLYFSDTDGDGKADTRRVVFSGFGTEDTHHLIHTLKWGPDGRLYWNQSIYIHSHLETPWGIVRLNSGGIFAFDPRTERVEVYAKGWCNPWGHAWDQWGQSFTTDGAGGQGVSWVIPGAMYFTYENARRIAPSISPGNYPKFCSLELIHSPMFPDDWQGNAVTNDFRAHRIVRFAIEDLSHPSHPSHDSPPSHGTDGSNGKNGPALSGYTTKEMPDLVRTNDQSFRPIDIRLGPDGALYVADWSNPVINHGEVDFRDPRRDHHMGRIWRISKKDTPPVKWEPLLTMAAPAAGRDGSPSRPPQRTNADDTLAKESSKADGSASRPYRGGTPLSNEALLEKLLSKNAWEQEHARRVMGNRDASDLDPSKTEAAALEVLRKELQSPSADNRSALVILPALRRLATSTDSRFRALAVRLYPSAISSIAAHFKGVQANENAETEAMTDKLKKAIAAEDRTAIEEVGAWLKNNPHHHPSFETLVSYQRDALAEMAADPNPRVRVEAMRALSRNPRLQNVEVVLEAAMKSPGESDAINARGEEKGGQFDKPTFSDTKDPYYGYAAWLSINDLAKPWTDAIASGAWKADTAERQQQLAWGLRAIDPALAGATISRLFSENKIPLDGTGPWIELLGQSGGAKELRGLLDKLAAAQLPAEAEPRALAALADAARLRNARPEGELRHALDRYLPHAKDAKDAKAEEKENPSRSLRPSREAQSAALRLLGAWKVEDAVIDTAAAIDAKTPAELRFASIDALRSIGSPASLNLLETLTRPDQDLAIRRAALVAITQVKLDAGVVKAADVLPAITDENAALETWRALLAVKGAPEAFAVRLPKELPKPVATAGIRAAREAGKNGAKLLAALTPLAGISDAEAKMPKDFKALAAQTKQNGDPARGELIYRRAALTCTVCHAIGGAGGKVGPDMTSLGASAPLDYIIESTLNPTVKVKEGYNAVTLTLKDGTQAVGVQTRETPEEVFLRDATGREQRVPKAQIASTANLGSLMPAGLTDQLQDRERLDLFAFLGELGKPGPYDASKGSVARYWQLANEPLQEDGTLHVNTAALPAYTLVDGRLLKDQLKELLPGVTARGETVVYAAAKFQSTGGKTRLKLTGASKVSLDGKPLAIGPDLAPDLAPGVHTIVVKLDVSALPEVLRAESPDARFLGN